MTRNRERAIIGVGTIIFAALVWTQARDFSFQSVQRGLGPALFPSLLVIAMGLLGVTFLFQAVISSSSPEEETERAAPRTRYGVVVSFVAILLLYAFGFSTVGWFPSTPIFLVVCMIIFDVTWRKSIVIAFVVTGVVYVLFVVVFRLPLP